MMSKKMKFELTSKKVKISNFKYYATSCHEHRNEDGEIYSILRSQNFEKRNQAVNHIHKIPDVIEVDMKPIVERNDK